MNRTYQYRLYPKSVQIESLKHILALLCEFYNAALEERREAYRKSKKSIRLYDQTYQIKSIRQIRDDFAKLNFGSCIITLMRLDKAYKAFFRRIKSGEKPGFPRFKSRKRFNSVCFTFGNGIAIKNNRLKIQGIGAVKVKWHREIPAEAKIKQILIKHRSDRWYAFLMLEFPEPQPISHTGDPIGLDLGLSNLVALSDGQTIAPPQVFRKSERRLRIRQRRNSRRKKFSERWRASSRLVSRLHEHIANQRKDFCHKLSTYLSRQYNLIAIEKLNIKGLAQSKLSKSINDAGWSLLTNQLGYKVENTGSQLICVDPYRTSQICSGCDSIVQKNLSVRTHECPDCGLVLDRDVNAARNILQRALSPPGMGGQPLT